MQSSLSQKSQERTRTTRMSLKSDIINNWKTDIIGYAQVLDSLENTAYPGWTVKYFDSYGVAIPYDGEEEINERFSNAQIRSDIISVSGGEGKRAIILTAGFSVAQGPFSTLCEELVTPGDFGKNRKIIAASPVAWWQEWKELLGNRNIDERVYDTLGELCVFEYLTKNGIEAEWSGPNAATYDIETEGGFVEVKSTTSRSKKEVTISSQFQLDPPGKTLDLVLCQFEASFQIGISIDTVVSSLTSMGVSSDYLNSRLSKKGLEEGMSARKRTFILHDMLKYKIDAGFPKITPASFVGGVMPSGITKVTYTVSLDGIDAQSLIQEDNNEVQNN